MARPDYVLLAAGKGTRLWPVTEAMPKVMVRIMGKPIIEWIAEGAAPQANKVIVIVGAGKEQIISHFKGKPYLKKMVFVEQEKQLGTGHAVLQAEAHVKGDFVTINADTFFDPSMFGLLRKSAKKGNYFAVAKRVSDASKYGVYSVKAGRVAGLVEKPPGATEGLISTGIFHLPRAFFSLIRKLGRSPRGEYELTDAVAAFAKASALKAIEFKDYWNDTGYYWNYLDASAYALDKLMPNKRLGKVEGQVTIKGRVFIGKGAVVKAGTYIEGPVFIGENAIVGPRAYLRPHASIESGCHVGNGTEVKNSIFMRGSNAAHLSYVGDSIVCDNVNLGAGTVLANLRFDDAPVKVVVGEKKVVSEKRKLGCVMGEGTKTGANVVVNPGILVGSHCRIFPGVVVARNLPSGTTLANPAAGQ